MERDTISFFTASVQQEDLTIINIYAPNMGAANYIRQLITKAKKHIDNNTIIVGDFNTPLTEMDRSSKQKINKEIKTLNDTLDLNSSGESGHPSRVPDLRGKALSFSTTEYDTSCEFFIHECLDFFKASLMIL